MSILTWLQSTFSAHSTPRPSRSDPKAVSLRDKSASQITAELARRGDGSMARGVNRTAQKAYWKGRSTQSNIDKGKTKP